MYIPEIPQNNLTEQITEIVKLCEQLANKHYFSFNPPATENDIADWETKNNTKIPEDYKNWLRFSNGSNISSASTEFYGINQIEVYNPPLIEDYMVIGSIVGDGEMICFSKSTGKIFTDDHGDVKEYEFKGILNKVTEWLQDEVAYERKKSDRN
jgi:hypothetical protein